MATSQQKPKSIKTVSGLQGISPKTMFAFTLVALMAMLWGRVLLKGKGGPETANAQSEQQSQETSQAIAEIEIVPVELSVLDGRNNRLTSDVFSADNWSAFAFHEKAEEPVAEVVNVAPPEDPAEKIRKKHQANLDKIAKNLTLEAVIQGADGKPSKVFIDEKILAVGSVLTVQEGPETYLLLLAELTEKEALFVWDGFSLVLQMTETVEQ